MNAKTLYDKLWDDHCISTTKENESLLYIDKQLLHEVTSPQAFSGLKKRKRTLWSNSANWAVVDHNVPTINRELRIHCSVAKKQIETLYDNCMEHNIECFKFGSNILCVLSLTQFLIEYIVCFEV